MTSKKHRAPEQKTTYTTKAYEQTQTYFNQISALESDNSAVSCIYAIA